MSRTIRKFDSFDNDGSADKLSKYQKKQHKKSERIQMNSKLKNYQKFA
jgi:hypothetical protein